MNRNVSVKLVFLLFALLSVSILALAQSYSSVQRPEKGARLSCAVIRVYDGDTVTLDCNRQQVRVRVWGIDAPEIGQKPWGIQARDHLRGLLSDTAKVEVLDYDRYGRAVARIYHGREDIGLVMVRQGQAAVYEQYNDAAAYYKAECQAREEQIGIWSQDGDHRRPWEWRRR